MVKEEPLTSSLLFYLIPSKLKRFFTKNKVITRIIWLVIIFPYLISCESFAMAHECVLMWISLLLSLYITLMYETSCSITPAVPVRRESVRILTVPGASSRTLRSTNSKQRKDFTIKFKNQQMKNATSHVG